MKKTTTRKKKRLNPLGSERAFKEMLGNYGVDLMVNSALGTWSKDEKLLLIAMLPGIRDCIVKQIPKAKLAEMVGGPEVKVNVKADVKAGGVTVRKTK